MLAVGASPAHQRPPTIDQEQDLPVPDDLVKTVNHLLKLVGFDLSDEELLGGGPLLLRSQIRALLLQTVVPEPWELFAHDDFKPQKPPF